MARTRAKAPAAGPATPWWLMEGDEECPELRPSLYL